jgi:hypothetical protein
MHVFVLGVDIVWLVLNWSTEIPLWFYSTSQAQHEFVNQLPRLASTQSGSEVWRVRLIPVAEEKTWLAWRYSSRLFPFPVQLAFAGDVAAKRAGLCEKITTELNMCLGRVDSGTEGQPRVSQDSFSFRKTSAS